MSQLPKQPAEVTVPTSADVARLAGVSRATVSYVLNNNATVRISDPTRRRVREAALQLGYVPHAAARSLRAGHSRMVLLPSGHIPAGPPHQYFFEELQAGLRSSWTTPSSSTAAPYHRRRGGHRLGRTAARRRRRTAGHRPHPARHRHPDPLRSQSGDHPGPRPGGGGARTGHGPAPGREQRGGAPGGPGPPPHRRGHARAAVSGVLRRDPPRRGPPRGRGSMEPAYARSRSGTRRSRRTGWPPAGRSWGWTRCSPTTTRTPCC